MLYLCTKFQLNLLLVSEKTKIVFDYFSNSSHLVRVTKINKRPMRACIALLVIQSLIITEILLKALLAIQDNKKDHCTMAAILENEGPSKS